MIDMTGLNPMQREAVEYTEGPLLIFAGAGSGKTRVLTYRTAHLLEMGVRPYNILAITFTNKAAREMRTRILDLAGESAEEVWVSTFHSLCARILRRDIEKMMYKRDFVIYDEDDRLSVIKGIVKSKGLRDDVFQPKMIKSVISDAKNRLLSPEEWLAEAPKDQYNRQLYEIYAEYEKQLRSNNALDFDDLILKTLELFSTNPPVLDYYRQRFRYIMVDEYQDTNMAQYELVRILASGSRNLCVVGDDDQSIYGWRGADIRNILEFEKDFPDTKTVKLEQNYRSTSVILEAANRVIAHNHGRKEKTLWTETQGSDPIILYDAQDERDEAAYVAQCIRKNSGPDGREGDFAVLYRTNAQSRILEEAFVKSGIRYAIYGGMRFYERKEVKDLIAYMRCLMDPDDDVSVRRIINEPKRSIGDTTVDALAEYAQANNMSLMNAVFDAENAGLSKRAAGLVAAFGELMLDLTESSMSKSLTGFFEDLLEKTGYMAALEKNLTDENRNRIENIREFQGAVTEYEKKTPDGTLTDFLENVALISDTDTDSEGKPVLLMTVHSAKGLEFDTVFLTGMEENIFPLSRSVTEPEELEEERRLCYVGITRAKRHLYITHARNRMLYNVRRADPLSRFVNEIPRTLIRNARLRSAGTDMTRIAPVHYTTPEREERPAAPLRHDTQIIRSKAADMAPVSLFQKGDVIMHRTFGKGVVFEVEGTGKDQILRIDFGERGIKRMNASIAPLVKVKR